MRPAVGSSSSSAAEEEEGLAETWTKAREEGGTQEELEVAAEAVEARRLEEGWRGVERELELGEVRWGVGRAEEEGGDGRPLVRSEELPFAKVRWGPDGALELEVLGRRWSSCEGGGEGRSLEEEGC